jgi:hypothetical protein
MNQFLIGYSILSTLIFITAIASFISYKNRRNKVLKTFVINKQSYEFIVQNEHYENNGISTWVTMVNAVPSARGPIIHCSFRFDTEVERMVFNEQGPDGIVSAMANQTYDFTYKFL